VIDQIDIYLEY